MDYQQRNHQQRHGNNGGNQRSGTGNSSNSVGHRNNMISAGNSTGSGPPLNAGGFNLQTELLFIKQDAAQTRNAVFALEQEKESLRKAIRKLKLENSRVRQKVKRLQETVNDLKGVPNDAGSDINLVEKDYDELGHNFILVGGVQDPLSSSFDSKIKDENGVEHKSAERLYWYMIADHFKDETAKKKILEASNSEAAENAVKSIENFSEKVWNEHRLEAWKHAQQLKLDQHREILNLLVLSKGIYIGVASHDKFFGTGWRKNREEANKPVFWDGENEGGKVLMRLRDEYKLTHNFENADEEESARKKFSHNRRFIWRRLEQMRRGPLAGPQPLIVRTGLANRRGVWMNRRNHFQAPMGYGAPPIPNYYASISAGPIGGHPPQQQQWSNKKRDGNGGQNH
ncbi:NADAR domain-containing protein [Aphelenchoides besseyi]|nr:NADAR domain-containing protein [Aphelenchoides besseyi]KAI6227198.1 NADAR domain-containing protein [Aphelenchoides besseyi]